MDDPEAVGTKPPVQGRSHRSNKVVSTKTGNSIDGCSSLSMIKQETGTSNIKMEHIPPTEIDEDEARDDLEAHWKEIQRLEKRKHAKEAKGKTLSWADQASLNAKKKALEDLKTRFPHLAAAMDQREIGLADDSRNGPKTARCAPRQSEPQKRKYAVKDNGEEITSQNSSSRTKKPKLKATSGPAKKCDSGKGQPLDDTTATEPGTGNSSTHLSEEQPEIGLVQKQFNELGARARQMPEMDESRIKTDEKLLGGSIEYIGEDNLNVTAQNGRWLVNGMKTALFSYQLDGTGWMCKQEHRKTVMPRGGILADEMGAGKTITTLAMLTRGTPPQNHEVKTTLLFVKNEQMAQHWMNQSREHCENLAMFRWNPNGPSNFLNLGMLTNTQVMVMTYGELQTAWSKAQAGGKRVHPKRAKVSKKYLSNCSSQELLFSVEFYRIILDEGHCIKNHLSETAKAMFEVTSYIQWIITATPAPNHPDEYYSYLKVFQMPETDQKKRFTAHWLRNVPEKRGARTRLDAELVKFQLRRGYKTKLLGEAVFQDVPECFEETIIVHLTEEERLLYDIVVKPVRRELKQIKDGADGQTVGDATADNSVKDRKYFFNQILRLQWLTAHPFIVEGIFKSEYITPEQADEIHEALKNLRGTSSVCNQINELPQSITNESSKTSSFSSSADLSTLVLTRDDSTKAKLNPQIQLVMGAKAEEHKCHTCPRVTIPQSAFLCKPCGHAWCKAHIEAMKDMHKRNHGDDPLVCLSCEKAVENVEEIDQTEWVEAYAVFQDYQASSVKARRAAAKAKGAISKKPHKRGDDFHGCQPRQSSLKSESSQFLELADQKHPEEPLFISAKLREILDIISRWQIDAPDDKILVFTQSVLSGRILGRLLEDKNVKFLYYFGSMTDAERTRSLDTLRDNKDLKIMIMGLLCGGTGLDLPFANRVILMTPFWNEAQEKQAKARVMRKNQTKPTFFVKLVAADSIDTRITDIQEAKERLTARLREETDPRKRAALEAEFLKNLEV